MPSSTDIVLSLLNQTNELARKLSENLDPSRIEICRTIARDIISSTEMALCAAKSSTVGVGTAEILNPEFRDKKQRMSKKRKILANTTRQEIVCTDGAEVPPNDGHSWRKYGQKVILGAKYPRSYYRCTHRNSEGCSATKQVQKSDENPSIFDITYLGTHTCFSSMQQATTTCFYNQQKNLFEVKTESSYFENQGPTTSFSFSSTPIEGINTESALFCSSSNSYFPYEMNSQEDSGLADLVSATNSLTDSPVLDLELLLANGEMDAEITFDPSIFFNEGIYSLLD